MLSCALLLLTLPASPAAKAPACEPTDCLKAISAKAAVAAVELSELDVAGQWSAGPGLSGSELYLFQDKTYIYTEWADIEPETIYDKGHWALALGLLTLSPDATVVWEPSSDRRYLTLREAGRSESLLFGLDRTIGIFERLVVAEPHLAQDYIRVASLQKLRAWSTGQARRVKADLMKRCWRPTYFAR